MHLANDPAPYEERFEERTGLARAAAQAIEPSVLDSTDSATLIDLIVAQHAAPPIVPLYERFRMDPREGVNPVNRSPVMYMDLVLPFTGAAQVMSSVEPRIFTGGRGEGSKPFEWSISFVLNSDAVSAPEEFAKTLADLRTGIFTKTGEAVEAANKKIAQETEYLRHEVEDIVVRRHTMRAMLVGAARALDIPLARSDIPLVIPIQPQLLDLARAEAAANDGADEFQLSAEIADSLIEQIGAFSRALERAPLTSKRLAGNDEETMRDVLLFLMNANWRGHATGETFLGAGKTDILLRWRDRDAFIAECKFWKGGNAFAEGVEQLLGRYTIWRATRVALVLFIRDVKDVSSVIEKACDAIRQHSRYVADAQQKSQDHFNFLMNAQSDSTRMVNLTLVPVVLSSVKVEPKS